MSSERIIQTLMAKAREKQGFDPKEWAKRLRLREFNNPHHNLTAFQRHCWRSALGFPDTAKVEECME